MKRNRKFWTCPACGPRGIHHYAATRCQSCGRPGLIETIKRPSIRAMIEHAVRELPAEAANVKPLYQPLLFEEST